MIKPFREKDLTFFKEVVVGAAAGDVMILAIKATLVEDVGITIVEETGIIISDLVGIKSRVAYVFFIVVSYIYYIRRLCVKLFDINNN